MQSSSRPICMFSAMAAIVSSFCSRVCRMRESIKYRSVKYQKSYILIIGCNYNHTCCAKSKMSFPLSNIATSAILQRLAPARRSGEEGNDALKTNSHYMELTRLGAASACISIRLHVGRGSSVLLCIKRWRTVIKSRACGYAVTRGSWIFTLLTYLTLRKEFLARKVTKNKSGALNELQDIIAISAHQIIWHNVQLLERSSIVHLVGGISVLRYLRSRRCLC
jgi:hypothetical protein